MNETTSVQDGQAGFEDRCIVSCGIVHRELTHLVKTAFISPRVGIGRT